MSRPPRTVAFQTSHRLLKAADGRLRTAISMVRAVHSGLWLGALSPEELVALDEATYEGTYKYHLTEAHNLRGLFEWEEAVLRKHFPSSGVLLVTSTGGGREVVALRKRGYEVDAFECNAQLRASANRLLEAQGFDGNVALADRNGWVESGRSYDGILVGWGSYTNIRGRDTRVRFLRGLRDLAQDGAPLLVSFYARPANARAFRVAASVGRRVSRWLGQPGVEEGDVIDPTFQHYFTQKEMFRELEDAGFEPMVWSAEGYAHAVARARLA